MTLHLTPVDGSDLVLWVAFGFVFYFLPYVIAVLRSNGREAYVLLINAALGWTIAGWFFAMNLALHDAPRRAPSAHIETARARRRGNRHRLYSISTTPSST